MNVDPLYEYSRIRILIGKKETNPQLKNRFPVAFMGGTSGKEYQTSMSFDQALTPGTYFILVDCDQDPNSSKDLVLASYSLTLIPL